MPSKILLLSTLLLLAGCETVSYYTQATSGQLRLLSKREDIDALIAAADTDERKRRQLQLVQAMKRFAAEQLALPADNSFSGYVQLEGDYPVWSVVATPEFSLRPHQWCYPVIGCAAYRGYFKQAAAERKGRQMRERGFDVQVGGVPAYSTLGWFDDPVLSSYLYWREADLAGLVFHELAHQVFYIGGDSAINESFAVAVERAGVERWLRHRRRDDQLAAYRQRQVHREVFLQLLQDTREQLDRLYAGDLPAAEKRRVKAQYYQQLRQRYLSRHPQGPYKAWVSRELNNAMLASINTYSQWVPNFLQKLHSSGSMAEFYDSVKALQKLPVQQRYRRLETWLDKAVPPPPSN